MVVACLAACSGGNAATLDAALPDARLVTITLANTGNGQCDFTIRNGPDLDVVHVPSLPVWNTGPRAARVPAGEVVIYVAADTMTACGPYIAWDGTWTGIDAPKGSDPVLVMVTGSLSISTSCSCTTF